MAIVVKPLNERAFQRQVLDFAKLHLWKTAHFRAARTSKGWRTPLEGDAAGFPDLILVRGKKMLVVELKIGRNKPSPEQYAWLAAFEGAGIECHVWYPTMWSDIERILSGRL